jgi:ATP-binding cassette subfamily C protein CydC
MIAPVWMRLLNVLRQRWSQMMLAILLGFATIASSVGLMSTSAFIIARAALQPSIAELQVAIVAVRFFGLARGLARYLERLISHRTSLALSAGLRQWIYGILEPLYPAGLQERTRGDLVARLASDVAQLQDFFVRSASPFVVSVLTIAFTLILMATWSLAAAGILLLFVVLGGVLWPGIVHRLARSSGREVVAARVGLHNKIIDALEGLPELIVWGQQSQQIQQVIDHDLQWMLANRRLARVRGANRAVYTALLHLATLSVLVVMVPSIQMGELDGTLLSVAALTVIAAFEALAPLGQAAENLQADLTSASRLFEIADQQAVVSAPSAPVAIPKPFDLRVQDVSFRFDGSSDLALDRVSITFQPGKTILIAGPSGAGKSTFLEMLLRLWPIQAGQIIAAGVEIDRFDPHAWRRAWATLPQPAQLIGETLRQNLLLGQPDATDADMVEALDSALARQLMEALPDGLNTWIGEAGSQLSGGEQQRVALARAFLRRNRPLLLDEPTAHLDPITALQVLKNILRLAEGQGAIIVSHWLAGLEMVDEIIVLQDGRVTERGQHQQLLKQAGWYAQQWQLHNSQAALARLA